MTPNMERALASLSRLSGAECWISTTMVAEDLGMTRRQAAALLSWLVIHGDAFTARGPLDPEAMWTTDVKPPPVRIEPDGPLCRVIEWFPPTNDADL